MVIKGPANNGKRGAHSGKASRQKGGKTVVGERFQTVVLRGVDANADVPPPAAKPAPSASKPSAPAAKRTEGNRVGVLRQGSTTLPTRHDRDINAKQCNAQANHEERQREYNQESTPLQQQRMDTKQSWHRW